MNASHTTRSALRTGALAGRADQGFCSGTAPATAFADTEYPGADTAHLAQQHGHCRAPHQPGPWGQPEPPDTPANRTSPRGSGR